MANEGTCFFSLPIELRQEILLHFIRGVFDAKAFHDQLRKVEVMPVYNKRDITSLIYPHFVCLVLTSKEVARDFENSLAHFCKHMKKQHVKEHETNLKQLEKILSASIQDQRTIPDREDILQEYLIITINSTDLKHVVWSQILGEYFLEHTNSQETGGISHSSESVIEGQRCLWCELVPLKASETRWIRLYALFQEKIGQKAKASQEVAAPVETGQGA